MTSNSGILFARPKAPLADGRLRRRLADALFREARHLKNLIPLRIPSFLLHSMECSIAIRLKSFFAFWPWKSEHRYEHIAARIILKTHNGGPSEETPRSFLHEELLG
jgi:hypothetical protein